MPLFKNADVKMSQQTMINLKTEFMAHMRYASCSLLIFSSIKQGRYTLLKDRHHLLEGFTLAMGKKFHPRFISKNYFNPLSAFRL